MSYKKIYMSFNIKRHIHARVIFRCSSSNSQNCVSHARTLTAVCVRTTQDSNSQVLKPLALGNEASQLTKHKQIYKWAAERALNRTDLSWSRSRMPTLAFLVDVQHLIPLQVRDAVLTKFTAGTVLESAKGGPLILG